MSEDRLAAAEKALRAITEASTGYNTWGEYGDYGADCDYCEEMQKIASAYFKAYPISKDAETEPSEAPPCPAVERSAPSTGKDKG